MDRKILCIDFSIFAYNYLKDFEIQEFDYWLRDSSVEYPFDVSLFNDLTSFLYSLKLKKENIHFTYRQEDIIPFLKGDSELYNIDLYCDLSDYYYLVDNKSWAKYALDKGLIKDYKWIYIYQNENNLYGIGSVFDLDLSLLEDVNELFISLSPEYSMRKYHNLFKNIINVFNNMYSVTFSIDDYIWNWSSFDNSYNENNCYVTLLTSEKTLNAVIGLQYSLLKCNSKYPLVVLVSNLFSQSIIDSLEFYNIRYQKIKDLRDSVFEIDLKEYDKNILINKLYSYLLNYEKVMYLPEETLITENIDYLFDKKNITILSKQDILDTDGFIVESCKNIPEKEFKIENKVSLDKECKYWKNKSIEDMLKYIDLYIDIKRDEHHG